MFLHFSSLFITSFHLFHRLSEDFLAKKKPLDSQDHKGITPLGYAIGANRIAVVKLLLDSRANPYAVDSSGNSPYL